MEQIIVYLSHRKIFNNSLTPIRGAASRELPLRRAAPRKEKHDSTLDILKNRSIFVKNSALKFQKYIYFFLFLTGPFVFVAAQTASNPFELTPRLSEPVTKVDTSAGTEALATEANPFEVVANKAPAPPHKPLVSVAKPDKPVTAFADKTGKAFLFPVVLTILLLLTIFLTLFRSYVSRVYKAVFRDNMLHQLYSDRQNIGLTTAFIPLYLLFFLNAGLFLFLIANHFGLLPEGNQYFILGYITAGITGLFLLKHLVLIFTGLIFPVEKEVSTYNFTIVVFSIFTGLLLVPFNLSIAYMPPEMTRVIIFTTLGIIALIYLLRYLRGLFIADKFFQFHKFHFLLYICTVEITPVLFLYRFFMNYLQG